MTARLVSDSSLQVYKNAAHGLFATHADRLNADLLAFARGPRSRAVARARDETAGTSPTRTRPLHLRGSKRPSAEGVSTNRTLRHAKSSARARR